MKTNKEQASKKMMQLITAKWISKPIYVVVKLGIPDILTNGPLSITEIAERCNAHAPFLLQIMKALASIKIFREKENQVFELTEMAECLKKDSMRDIVLMLLSDWHDAAWNCLLESIQTGKVAFNLAHGEPAFDWLNKNPEIAEIVCKANTIKAAGSFVPLVNVYDFSNVRNVIDIGGGYGVLMTSILKANPHLSGCILDLPFVLRNTEVFIKDENLEQRCKLQDCDFFKEIPKGYDMYLMSNIIHDWDDEKCKIILKNCFNAMGPDTKLLIIEMIIPTGNNFSIVRLLDLEVLVMGGGKERTEIEYRNLIKSAGFYINNIIPVNNDVSIIECIKKR